MKIEILPMQIWRHNITEEMYRVSSTTPEKVELYLFENPWVDEIIIKEELYKNYTFIEELI